jgi:flagellar biosynthetic protein FliQ
LRRAPFGASAGFAGRRSDSDKANMAAGGGVAMTEGDAIAQAGQQALWTALMLGGPLLGALLVVGVVVALLQAMTQLQEPALAFVPKMLVVGLALLFGAPMAAGIMRGFSAQLFDQIVAAGGMR